MLFLLTVAGTASLMTIHSSRPTQAESVLYTVVCTVGGLLGQECRTVPADPTTPAPSPSPSPQPSPQPNQNPSNPPGGNSSGNTTQPLELNQGPLAQVSSGPLTQGFSSVNTFPDVTFPSHTLQPFRSGSGVAVLGTASPASLEATPDGWKIVGIQWYWWLISIAAILATAYLAQPGRWRALVKLAKR